MRRHLIAILRVLGTLALGLWLVTASADAQPYSAQIQRALTAFIAAAHTWSGAQTFPLGISFNGLTFQTCGSAFTTCINFGGGNAVLGSNDNWLQLRFNGATRKYFIGHDGTATYQGSSDGFPTRFFGYSGSSGSTANAGTGYTEIGTHGGMEFHNADSNPPVLSSCGSTPSPTLATGSSNNSGRATTGGTGTACTVTFGYVFIATDVDCQIGNMTANRGFVSATSTAAFTVSGLTAGDTFSWHCFGHK